MEILKRLRADGWEVLTVWECEVRELDTVAERISTFLRSQRIETP
jgi:DNA mismatch endonuclease (patch repair protein)